MSTIHGTTGIRPATAMRQYYSPLEAYWDAFREWRKFERLRTQLCRLTDGELMDIGITRGEIDYVVKNGANDREVPSAHKTEELDLQTRERPEALRRFKGVAS